MAIAAWLHTATAQLQAAGVSTARLDCLVLLEDVLNTNRTHILAHPERQITEAEQQKLTSMIDKRVQHIPLAYIRGKTEFYGRDFIINQAVLEPRPESETLVDLLKALSSSMPLDQHTVVDVGTGSGALAITAKLELPDTTVYATDIDQKCLQLARRNAEQHQTAITFVLGHLLEPLEKELLSSPVVLLCNLPYVPDNFQINTAATHEPRRAIFGGADGLDLYRQLFEQLASRPTEQPQYVLCESLPPQHPSLQVIAEQTGFHVVQTRDFIQCFAKPNN